MTKSIRLNYVFNLIYNIFTVLTPLITTPYVARVLHADGVGLYSYTYSIATAFVALAQFGTSTYGQRQIAYCRNDIRECSRVFWNVFLLRFMNVAISLVIYYAIFFNSEHFDMFLLQSMCIIATAFDISWFFSGVEEFGLLAIRDGLSKAVSIVCVFVFVKTSDDVGLYTFILAAAIIGGRLLSWIPLPRYLRRVPLRSINIFENFREILVLFIPQIASQLSYIIDKSMIGLLTDSTYENGYYMQAERIISLSLTLSTSVVGIMFPRVSAMFAEGNQEGIMRLVRKVSRFLWMLCLPVGAGVIVLIDMVVPWFLGSGYDKVILLTQMMSVQFLITGIQSGISSLLLVARKRQNEYTMCIMVGAVSNICLNACLIPGYYSVGAVVATILSGIISTCVQLYMVRKEYRLREILCGALPYLIPTAVMAAVLMLIKQHMAYTFMNTVVLVALGMCIYFAQLWLTHEEIFMSNVVRMLQSFVNKRMSRKNG